MMSLSAETTASDGLSRCPWSTGAPELTAYHDAEWGFPVGEDQRLFEKLCLESFQSGLSWRTILNRREAFRAGFAGFEISAVARFGEEDLARLLCDAGIVRNRAKIEACIGNARRAEELITQEGSLAAFLWRFEPPAEELAEPQTLTVSPSSTAMAKELKRRGWRFFGPTTAFAFMQSMGLLNDHVHGCILREPVQRARAEFTRP
ncbi:DNA-3-methyladenine glycosylase I [Nesterenkonia lacusekhoensis]